jgi:inhibitor of KinA sporulation pathway (predicted exonuclease)
MNYIILDLEWNQSPRGKDYAEAGIPFEVIEIGAVKLNNQRQMIGEFNQLICPKIYKQLHPKVKEILGVSMDELNKNGKEFTSVINDFLEWCGKEYIFCTWGNMDLVELQRNMKYYNVENSFPKPLLFYDLQKLYSICYSDGKSRITLQHAIEELQMNSKEEYHWAVNDARYTARVFEKMDFNKVSKFYSVDTYWIPQSRKDEVYLNFGSYEKFISKGFKSREAAASDREVRSCKCFLCKRPMKREIKWFSTNTKNYYGMFSCEEHGLIKGRFRIKQSDNGQFYAVKIFKCTDEAGAQKIHQRQVREKEHRRMKRKAQGDSNN